MAVVCSLAESCLVALLHDGEHIVGEYGVEYTYGGFYVLPCQL